MTPLTFAPLTATVRLAGENVKPVLAGMTRYDPFTCPLKLKAPAALAVVLAVAVPPRLTDAPAPSPAGVMAPEIEKVGPGARATTRAAVVVRIKGPLVPVMVSVELPAGVLVAVVTASVAFPDPVTAAGVNAAVAFAGSPVTARFTVPANPFSAEVVTEYVVPLPCVTVCEPGVEEIVKSGDGAAVGTICTAFTGARLLFVVDVPGVAVMVKPVPATLNFT